MHSISGQSFPILNCAFYNKFSVDQRESIIPFLHQLVEVTPCLPRYIARLMQNGDALGIRSYTAGYYLRFCESKRFQYTLRIPPIGAQAINHYRKFFSMNAQDEYFVHMSAIWVPADNDLRMSNDYWANEEECADEFYAANGYHEPRRRTENGGLNPLVRRLVLYTKPPHEENPEIPFNRFLVPMLGNWVFDMVLARKYAMVCIARNLPRLVRNYLQRKRITILHCLRNNTDIRVNLLYNLNKEIIQYATSMPSTPVIADTYDFNHYFSDIYMGIDPDDI